MGRPLKFNREDAIETAMSHIWRNGYRASSVKKLSEEFGITRSSFYNAFDSREALFREVLARYLRQSPDVALADAAPGIRVRQLFTRTYREACRARAGDPLGRGCMLINGVAELCNGHDELGQVLEAFVLGSLARIEQLLEWGVEQGEIEKHQDLRGKALALQNLLMGLNIMCKVVRDEKDLWSAAKTTLKGLDMYELEG